MIGPDAGNQLDGLIVTAQAHLADLLLQRITARVRDDHETAAALRVEGPTEEGTILLAVLDDAGAPLASRDEEDDDSPAWDEDALDDLADAIGADLDLYVSLAAPADLARISLRAS